MRRTDYWEDIRFDKNWQLLDLRKNHGLDLTDNFIFVQRFLASAACIPDCKASLVGKVSWPPRLTQRREDILWPVIISLPVFHPLFLLFVYLQALCIHNIHDTQ